MPGSEILPVSSLISFPSRIIVCLSESGSKSGLLIIKGNSKDSEPIKGKEQNNPGVFLSNIILLF